MVPWWARLDNGESAVVAQTPSRVNLSHVNSRLNLGQTLRAVVAPDGVVAITDRGCVLHVAAARVVW